MALEATKTGLVARLGDYEPLRAFSQGGRYWDRTAQQLIRDGKLAEFLPPVELEEDEYGKFARFHSEAGGRELLGRSRPVGAHGVPPDQLQRLQAAIEEFQQKAAQPEVQPQNRELIERFQLPDLARHPELYRLVGPWWHRRLQILWGCERTRDCSLPARKAVAQLTPDKAYRWRRWLPALLLLLLLLLPAWWLSTHWPPFPNPRSERPAPSPSADSAPGTRRPKSSADDPERAAQQAQAEADKARAEADRARKEAEASQAEDARKRQKAAEAEAAAAKADAAAKKARADADKAKADASAASRFQIVLSEQGQPGVDGTMDVALEVRDPNDPARAIPVEQWTYDDRTLNSQRQLRARMKGGDHAVKAVIRDADGRRREVSAVVTVEPGKVIATGGKVSVQPQKQ